MSLIYKQIPNLVYETFLKYVFLNKNKCTHKLKNYILLRNIPNRWAKP